CLNRGLGLLDMRYLSDSEKQSLLGSSLIPLLEFETTHSGTEREVSLGRIWQSAEVAAEDGGFSSSVLLIMKRYQQPVRTTLERSDVRREVAQGICMTIDTLWYRCSVQFRCIYSRNDLELSIRYLFA